MKRNLLILAMAVMTMSCTERGTETDVSPLSKSEISGERLWQRISSEAQNGTYGQWPGHEGLRPGQSPHGPWHIVYANKVLRDALPVADSKAPYGSIIVKENYSTSRELDKLTVMAKVEDYSPETGDWFWASYSPDGKILAEGKPAGCLSCHSGRADNDYIIIKNLSDPLE